MEAGGGDVVVGRWALRVRRRSAERARRGSGSAGARRSRRSEIWRLKVGGRGRPTPTLRDRRRVRLLASGLLVLLLRLRGMSPGELERVLSSRWSHRPSPNRCHMLSFGGGGDGGAFTGSGNKPKKERDGLPEELATEMAMSDASTGARRGPGPGPGPGQPARRSRQVHMRCQRDMAGRRRAARRSVTPWPQPGQPGRRRGARGARAEGKEGRRGEERREARVEARMRRRPWRRCSNACGEVGKRRRWHRKRDAMAERYRADGIEIEQAAWRKSDWNCS